MIIGVYESIVMPYYQLLLNNNINLMNICAYFLKYYNELYNIINDLLEIQYFLLLIFHTQILSFEIKYGNQHPFEEIVFKKSTFNLF